MADPLTEAPFWAQVTTGARRIVLCSPDLESRCKGFVDAGQHAAVGFAPRTEFPNLQADGRARRAA